MSWFSNKEPSEEISYGQIVIITARWILLVSAWALTLWEPEETSAWQLRLPIVMLMAYSVGNFFLTVQWMKKSAILTQMVYLTSLADLTLISILIAALGSYTSNVFVFYFPALLALSVTFPKPVTAVYTSAVLAAYAAIWMLDAGSNFDTTDGQTLAIRLLMLGAVAFCGALYQQLEADRRAGKGKMFEIFATRVPEPRGTAREAAGTQLPVGMGPRE